jgi:molecular chaperone GrpE
MDEEKQNQNPVQEEPKTEVSAELEKYRKQAEEYLAGWRRAQADFINYKKDEIKRIDEFAKFANEGLLMELISLADDAQAAIEHMPEAIRSDHADWFKGMMGIEKKFTDLLEKYGVSKIKTAGEDFNPVMHDAVAVVPANGSSGKVVEEVRSGYVMHGKVIRPARVKISK